MPQHTSHFRVADISFSVTAAADDGPQRLLPSFAPFYLPEPGEDLALEAEVAEGAVSAEAEGKELGQFDCGGAMQGVYRLEDGYKFVISSPEGQLSAAMVATGDFSACTITLYGDRPTRAFGLNNALMVAFTFAAAYHNVVLMHASVVTYGGRGYLFQAPSGTGKSTHTGLWLKYIPGSELLNDDNPAVGVTSDGQPVVYGTPWSGKTPCYKNESAPVGAFVRLEQAKENEIKRLAKLQAFASVLSSCSSMIWDKPSYTAITRTVERLVMSAPAFHLKCLPDADAARLSFSTITPHE